MKTKEMQKGETVRHLDYKVGKTLIHFDLVEGPDNAPKVTPLFSMPKNQKALADLLTAAPDLLESAKAMFGSIDPSSIRTDTPEGQKYAALAAAIAKAEGR